MNYLTTIGLEVHVELSTKTKMFCSCPTDFGAPPNTQVCPGCLGLPGSLPVLNKLAVEYAIMAALALNCRVSEVNKFDRKNYFYPDLSKGYQISQFDLPIGVGGYVDIETEAGEKRVALKRIHMEEDAGKLLHGEAAGDVDSSFVDFNRAGVPLIEIVSEPDMGCAEEARAYLQKLRSVLRYLGISDVKMEEGSLRCDANISVRPDNCDTLGVPVEIKNIGSFRGVVRAIEFEEARQRKMLEDGEPIKRETRRYDEASASTISMRSKESAEDYRYFPEPDLPPLVIGRQWVESVRDSLPELPDEKVRRFVQSMGLPVYDASVLSASRSTADFFEACVELYDDAKNVANWIMGDLTRYMNERGVDPDSIPVSSEHLTSMLKMIDDGTISGKIAKSIFDEMCDTQKAPSVLIKEKGLTQISGASEIGALVDRILEAHPNVV